MKISAQRRFYTHIVDEQLRKASEANPLAEVKASKANKNPSKKEE